jgi:hypothetical protein
MNTLNNILTDTYSSPIALISVQSIIIIITTTTTTTMIITIIIENKKITTKRIYFGLDNDPCVSRDKYV